jgi:hypothetical protein
MPLRMGSLYDALLAAHVPEDQARKASEEVAGFDRDAIALRGEMAALRSEMAVIKWMLGTNILLTVGVLSRLLFIP